MSDKMNSFFTTGFIKKQPMYPLTIARATRASHRLPAIKISRDLKFSITQWDPVPNIPPTQEIRKGGGGGERANSKIKKMRNFQKPFRTLYPVVFKVAPV